MTTEALRKIDALVAEHVMHWVRVQPPKWDYDGPLPEQGEVLVPFSMVDAITAGQFVWPPKGIIPFDWMVPRFSSDVAAAWQVFERILDPNRTSLRPCGNGSEGLWWAVCHDEEMVAHAKTAPLAICLAALRTVGVEVPEDA